MPSICESELVRPSYSLCKITKCFINAFFCNKFILSILVCAIVPDFANRVTYDKVLKLRH